MNKIVTYDSVNICESFLGSRAKVGQPGRLRTAAVLRPLILSWLAPLAPLCLLWSVLRSVCVAVVMWEWCGSRSYLYVCEYGDLEVCVSDVCSCLCKWCV